MKRGLIEHVVLCAAIAAVAVGLLAGCASTKAAPTHHPHSSFINDQWTHGGRSTER